MVSIFKEIREFIQKYNNVPSKESLLIEMESKELPENIYTDVIEYIGCLDGVSENNQQWLVDQTEKWCKDRAINLALFQSMTIIEGDDEKFTAAQIPSILEEALAVSFDTSIGHDYIEDVLKRYESSQKKENKIPFDIQKLNDITNGGFEDKTLNLFIAGTNVRKNFGAVSSGSCQFNVG